MSAVEALQGGSHVAVFILADSGMGKSRLIEAVVAELGSEVTPVRIHGSASLSKVPYGVLGPFIVGLPVQEATSQLAVLRTLWSHLEEQKRATQKPLLLIVDDAHDLDEATAGILAELAAAGWAKLLVGAAARPGLPEPLLQLWFEGIAERHDLRPLTLAQTTEMLEGELGSQVLPNVAEILWEASGGNPMLLNGLLDDARKDGTLLRRNGVWLFTRHLNSHGDRLTDVVRRQLLLRSPEERQALNLVALAEPVSRELIESVVGEGAVGSLIDSELIRVTDPATGELRLWHTVYGDTLRNLISPARSLQLRQSLLRRMDSEPTSAEGLLRHVSWSIECGAEVEDRQLLRAAVLASRLYEDDLARKAAGLVKDPELQMAARAVIARTRYNASDYVAAREILDADFGQGTTLPSLLAGTLLWAAVLSALGHTPADIMERARVLQPAGERLAQARPEDAAAIRAAIAERMETMEAMVMALAGEYLPAPAAAGVAAGTRPANNLEATFRLCVDAERLLAAGKGLSAFAVMSQAIEAAGADHDELYFLADFLVVRAAAPAIQAGDWQAAETLLTGVVAGSEPSLISFGGGVHAAHGIILLYQGKAAQALNTLSAALEALRLTDPQQLFAFTAAMAFAAAAEVGAQTKAELFLADFENAPAALPRYMRALAAMAVVYGKARLGNYPGAIEELKRLGRPDDPGTDTSGLELDSLAFCLALGDTDSAPRLLELRDRLEGPRPAAICAYAAALGTDNAADHLEAAKTCEAAELWTFAALAYDGAAHAYRAAGDTLRERMANSQRKRCLDRADDLPGEGTAKSDDSLGILTRRERDIVALAVRGLTDRQIAAELQVSVRTVEGHLYRSYAKLNVKGREQLPGIGGR
ncbi:LuxR family transcriptional regulator [Arthrobacter sp. NicSoilB8]|uniref:helix-turn-helix transcriptional regulator n=1 Tax=Arthrobacter sp. NicSoilB8 TaxID=2830998 RepID=UPI001CC470D8|nr:LuxR family transcriptional regulator [Arthrobacter sp. NicSoilB8]